MQGLYQMISFSLIHNDSFDIFPLYYKTAFLYSLGPGHHIGQQEQACVIEV